jgi:F-type H+-transporting ATPase subunit epsilon
MATLKLEIVTPEAQTYSEEVDMVTLPSSNGELGIYPNHVPVLTQVVPGQITVHKGGRDFFLAIGEGFAEITGNRVAVLTDIAIKADDIDEVKAEEARKRAEARLQEKLSGEEMASVSASLAHSLAQLKVKRRQH